MDMGSARCENGTASNVEPVTDKNQDSLPAKNNGNLNRPNFYPCTTCGRKFTVRALAVHRSSCTKNADCCCSSCKRQPSNNDCSVGKEVYSSYSEKLTESNNCSKTADVTSSSDAFMEVSLLLSDTTGFPVGSYNSGCSTAGLSNSSAVSTNYLIFDQSNRQHVPEGSSSASRGLLLLHEAASLLALTNVKIESLSDGNVNSSCGQDGLDSQNVFMHHTEILNGLSKGKANIITGPSSSYVHLNHKLHCSICNVQLPWEMFGSHIVQHAATQNCQHLKCPICLKAFNRSAMLLIHFYKHMTDRPFICKDCQLTFPSCDDLKTHILKEHEYVETRPYHCYICMRRFSHPQTIINHMRLHSKETPFKCNECSRSFSQIGNLQRHFSVHRGDRPHKCPDCEKSFADPATLRNHVRIHTGETPFVCKVCSRGFSQIGNLKRHMARHLQTRPKNIIAAFNKSFQSRPTLSLPDVNIEEDDAETSEDVSVMTGEPTAVIEVTNKNEAIGDVKSEGEMTNFKDSSMASETVIALSQLKEQRKKHHWQLFNCPVCGKVYTWQHDLSIHFRIHTGEKPYSCNVCNKRFAQSGAVRIHKARHHNMPNCS